MSLAACGKGQKHILVETIKCWPLRTQCSCRSFGRKGIPVNSEKLQRQLDILRGERAPSNLGSHAGTMVVDCAFSSVFIFESWLSGFNRTADKAVA